MAKTFFTCGGAVDDGVDGQLQATCFEFYVDDAVARFDIGNDSSRIVNDILAPLVKAAKKALTAAGFSLMILGDAMMALP